MVDEEPGTKPLLVASTVWRNKGGEIVQIPALLDTGCNTSIILRSLLGKLLSVDGTVPKVKILHDATVLTAASGENMNANEFCEATFGFKGKQVVHRMYVLDKLACHQKLLLGMDFMREQRLNIDMATDIITLPEVQECTPLMSMQALCIEPQSTVEITLLPMSGHNLPTGINGYMYAHPSLEEGLIMFEGVQTTGEGCVSAWLTNTTDFQVYVDAGEAIAFWEADIDGEFELADSLTSEVELMVNALNVKRSLSKRIAEEEHMQRQMEADATASSQTRRKPNRVGGSASVTQRRGDHADAVAVEVAAEATHTRHHARAQMVR